MSFIRTLVAAIENHGPSVAVVEQDQRFTYTELDRESAAIAAGLRRQGVGAGDIVGVFATRSWRRCTAVLGAWRAGAGVLSLDPTMPPARIERILRGAAPSVLVHEHTSTELDTHIPQRTWEDLRKASPDDRLIEGEVAYAIATSGSTGTPKTVVVPWVTLANLGRWHIDHWRHEDLPHTLHSASIGFDVIYEDMVATWLAGAELVMVSESDRRDPFALVDLITSHRTARLFSPVGSLHSLAMVAEALPAKLPTLREIAVAGERLVINEEVRAFCRTSGIELVNQYGPSETHVVTQYRLDGDPVRWPDHPPIGHAVVGAELLCLDEGQLRPFRQSETAELVVAGDCVGLGYLGDEVLTAERFRTLEHRDGRRLRCYITGDQVSFDGTDFHFVGRLDDQLKVNGYRVEPGEVEAAILSVAGVRRAAVVGIRSNGGLSLAAYYTQEPETRVSAMDIRGACSSLLPSHMVPASVNEIEQFPLTPNGKIDKKALLAMPTTPRTQS